MHYPSPHGEKSEISAHGYDGRNTWEDQHEIKYSHERTIDFRAKKEEKPIDLTDAVINFMVGFSLIGMLIVAVSAAIWWHLMKETL